jgi:predicted DNA-binding transcriptional regulator AlpA
VGQNPDQLAKHDGREPYISLREVAARLGYSTRWTRERARLDGLPSRQLAAGGKYRFLWSEVETWWHDAAETVGTGHADERAT